MSLTNLQKKKLQIELNPKKDKTVYNLVMKLEKESDGEKGYVNKQLKKRLEMYQVLAEVSGEEDPIELVKKLLINMKTHGVPGDLGEGVKPPSEEAVDSAMDLLEGLNNW